MDQPGAALREAVRVTRMHSCDALLAADAVLREMEVLKAVIAKLRHANPDLVAAAEAEVSQLCTDP